MRRTPHFDKTKNEYITKLEKLYNVNPQVFYGLINYFTKAEYLIGYMDFSGKTEYVKLPEREKIYPATIWHSYYEVFILNNQSQLLNQESLKKHLDLITSENHFPQIILIASNDKNKQKIQQILEPVLPQKTDELNYNIAVISSDEFDKAFDELKEVAIKDTICKMNELLS